MRWFSSKPGEFAFLSVCGNATGIIAVGGMAQGVLAFGGALSVGVVAVGMNAVGSFAALGMNAVAPISLSLINGLGVLAWAGVNGWGVLSDAGTNASGLRPHGGVNSIVSVAPGLVVLTLLLVGSFLRRGSRERRAPDDSVTLAAFLASTKVDRARVRATLTAVEREGVVISSGEGPLETAPPEREVIAAARAREREGLVGEEVVFVLRRDVEEVVDEEPGNYRDKPHTAQREVIRVLDVLPRPAKRTFLPDSLDELYWVLSWSARFSAVATAALLVWLSR